MKVDELDIEVSKDENYKGLLVQCYRHAKDSRHPGTHNAALLVEDNKVVLYGVNNLPPGVHETKERLESPNKHIYPNHAERDVIYQAAKRGLKTKGLTMVMPWLPCINCANAIITSGIKHLIMHKQMIERAKPHWDEELKNAVQIMKEAEVKLTVYDGMVGEKAYMHSKEWDA